MFRIVCTALLLTWSLCFGAEPVASGSWIPTIHPPAGVPSNGWATVILDDGSILGVGNSSSGVASSRAFRYNVQTNEWSETGPLAAGVVGLAPTKLPNGMVMALGVRGADKKPIALLFDPATMLWTSAGDTPADNLRYDRKALGLSNGNVLILGFANKKFGGWVYDYITNSWSTAQALPFEVRGFAYAKNLLNGSVLVVANDTSRIGQWVGLLYDPTNDSWTSTGPLPSVMTSSPTGYTTLDDGAVFFLGFQQYPTIESAAVLYHPETRTWTKGGKLPDDLVNVCAATQLPNGLVLTSAKALMGRGIFSPLFNPATNRWKSGGTVPNDYEGLAIFGVRLDGMVWGLGYRKTGGADQMLYSPTLNTWTKGGAFPENVIRIERTGRDDGAMLIFTSSYKSVTEANFDTVLYFP